MLERSATRTAYSSHPIISLSWWSFPFICVFLDNDHSLIWNATTRIELCIFTIRAVFRWPLTTITSILTENFLALHTILLRVHVISHVVNNVLSHNKYNHDSTWLYFSKILLFICLCSNHLYFLCVCLCDCQIIASLSKTKKKHGLSSKCLDVKFVYLLIYCLSYGKLAS